MGLVVTGLVIRTLNEASLLGRTLNSLESQTECNFEVIIVDSGSTDATLEIAKNYGRAKIIEIPLNDFNYGKALNVGIEALPSNVEFVAMLSAHAVPCHNDWLEQILLPMRFDRSVFGVFGRQIPLPEHLSNPIVRAQAIDVYPKFYGPTSYYTATNPFFSNANSAIRYRAWQKLKFDETLPYGEDQHWAKNILTTKSLIAYQASAVVCHSHPENYRQFCLRRYRQELGSIKSSHNNRSDIFFKYLKKISQVFLNYIRQCININSIRGIHFDIFRLHLVNSTAVYLGQSKLN